MGGTASAPKPPPTVAELKKTLKDDNDNFYTIFREMNDKWPLKLNLYCWYLEDAYKSKNESTKIGMDLPNIKYCVDEALEVTDEQKTKIIRLIKEDMDEIISSLTSEEDNNFLSILSNLPFSNDRYVAPGARRWTPYEQLLLSFIVYTNDLRILLNGVKLGYSDILGAISHVRRTTTTVDGRPLINSEGHGSGVVTRSNGTKSFYRMRPPSTQFSPLQGGSNCKTKIKSNKKRKYSKKQKKQTRRR